MIVELKQTYVRHRQQAHGQKVNQAEKKQTPEMREKTDRQKEQGTRQTHIHTTQRNRRRQTQ